MLRKNKVLTIGGCALFLFISSLNSFGQENNLPLKDKRITIQMTERPLYTVFYRLIQKYDIAIGFEESELDRAHRHYEFETNIALDRFKASSSSDKEFLPPVPKFSDNLISLNFKDATLEDVMTSIVAQMKNYDWEINDDVVNIFPIKGRDKRLQRLLDLEIRQFYSGMGDPVGAIQFQLISTMPEFRTFLAENNLEYDTAGPGSSFEDRILPDGMGFSNMKFKELLNAITRSKRGGWILQIKNSIRQPGKELLKIYI